MKKFKIMVNFIGEQNVPDYFLVKQKIDRLGDLSKMDYMAVEPDALQFLDNNKIDFQPI